MKDTSYLVIALLILLFSCGDENPLNPDEQNQRGTISGKVTDQFEKPIVGVSVTTNKVGYNSSTIDGGIYSIPDIESDVYTLTFSCPEYFDTTMDTTIAIAKMAQIININMVMRKKTGTISGSITDTAGAALTNVTVTLSPTVDGVGSEKSINTGTDATFSIDKVELGIYEVQCTHPSYTAGNTPLCTLSSEDYTDTIAVTMQYNGGGDVGTITGTLKSGPGEVATLTRWSVSVLGTSFEASGDANSESVTFTISNVPTGTYSVECSDLKHNADTVKDVTVAVGKATDIGMITLTDDGTKWMNRSVLGQFSVHRDTVDTVILEVKGEGIPNWTTFESNYNKNYGTLSGVVLVPESGQAWEVRAKAFIQRNDSLIKIGQSKNVEFNKSSGDVELTEFVDPTNAIPTIEFTCTSSVKIKDSILFSPKITENFDGKITSYEWQFADGTTATTKDISRIFITENSNEIFTLTITDDDGNRVSKKHTISITDLTPEIEFLNIPMNISCNEDVQIPFNIIDDGHIVEYQFKMKGHSYEKVILDSVISFTTPDTADSEFNISLLVTDDDGNSQEKTLDIANGTFLSFFPSNNSSKCMVQTTEGDIVFVDKQENNESLRVRKVNSKGETIWFKSDISGTNKMYISSIHESTGKDLLLVCTKSVQTSNSSEVFLLTLSEEGLLKSTTSLGDGRTTNAILSDKNILITGITEDKNLLLISVSENGTVNWNHEHSMNDYPELYGNAITQSSNGTIFITGKSYKESITGIRAFLVKCNSSGDLEWHKEVSDTMGSEGVSILLDNLDNMFISTKTSAKNDDDTRSAIGIIKLDLEGNTLAFEKFLIWDDAQAHDLTVTDDRNLLLCGNADTYRNSQVLLIKFDTNCSEIWRRKFNRVLRDDAVQVLNTKDKGHLILGFSTGYAGDNRTFLMKTDANGKTLPFE